MNALTKYKAFRTRISKFITNKLGGKFLSNSKSSESIYFTIFDLKIRISDHLSHSKDNVPALQIICPLFNTSEIVVVYKNLLYVYTSEKELKGALKYIALTQQQLLSSEENIEECKQIAKDTSKIQQTIDDLSYQLLAISETVDALKVIQDLKDANIKNVVNKYIDNAFSNIAESDNYINLDSLTMNQLKSLQKWVKDNCVNHVINVCRTQIDLLKLT